MLSTTVIVIYEPGKVLGNMDMFGNLKRVLSRPSKVIVRAIFHTSEFMFSDLYYVNVV